MCVCMQGGQLGSVITRTHTHRHTRKKKEGIEKEEKSQNICVCVPVQACEMEKAKGGDFMRQGVLLCVCVHLCM